MSDLVLVANAGDSTISTYVLDTERGQLTPLAVSPVGRGCSTFAIDEVADRVYAAAKASDKVASSSATSPTNHPGIDTFTLDHGTGTLTPAPDRTRTATEGSPSYLALSPDRRVLTAALYHEGTAATWPVGSDGLLGERASHVEWAHAHCVVATDEHLYVVSLGSDCIAQYSLATDGELTPLDPPTAPAPEGSGPRHLVLDADGTHAYAVTEFSGEVLSYRRDPGTGALTSDGAATAYATDRDLGHSRLGADPRAEHLIWGADLHLARDGRWILASERTESTVAALRLDRNGIPGAATHFVSTPRQPRGFAVSTDGRYAVVAGEESTHLAVVEVSPEGDLHTVDAVETGAGANWVRCLRRHD
ncbi:MAG: beta-propeller fold lactonase family protein [Tetrasphaera sp.]|nr:beta-propeller fold lactonase family protein [Tetrasphaera sp.]